MGKTGKKKTATVKKQKRTQMIYFHSHLENECNLLSATVIKCAMTHSNVRSKNYSNKTVENFRFTLFCVRKHLEGSKILSVVC